MRKIEAGMQNNHHFGSSNREGYAAAVPLKNAQSRDNTKKNLPVTGATAGNTNSISFWTRLAAPPSSVLPHVPTSPIIHAFV